MHEISVSEESESLLKKTFRHNQLRQSVEIDPLHVSLQPHSSEGILSSLHQQCAVTSGLQASSVNDFQAACPMLNITPANNKGHSYLLIFLCYAYRSNY